MEIDLKEMTMALERDVYRNIVELFKRIDKLDQYEFELFTKIKKLEDRFTRLGMALRNGVRTKKDLELIDDIFIDDISSKPPIRKRVK